MADEIFKNEVNDEAKREHEADQCGDSDQLCSKLACVPIKEACDRASDTVPASTVVASPICEKADREDAPQATRTMDRDGADWIVHLQDVLEKRDAQANEHSGDEANDARVDWVDK